MANLILRTKFSSIAFFGVGFVTYESVVDDLAVDGIVQDIAFFVLKESGKVVRAKKVEDVVKAKKVDLM